MSLFAASSAGEAAWIHPEPVFTAADGLRKGMALPRSVPGVSVPAVQHYGADQSLAFMKTVVEGLASWFETQGVTMANAVEVAAGRIVDADGGPR